MTCLTSKKHLIHVFQTFFFFFKLGNKEPIREYLQLSLLASYD